MLKGIYRHKEKPSSRDTSIHWNDSSINQDSQILAASFAVDHLPFLDIQFLI